MGHHAAKVENSRDLILLVALFKRADYPLSAQEISKQAYPNSDDVFLNAAEKVGQIRAPVNSERGYALSYSTRWRVAASYEDPGKRVNKDLSVTFLIEKQIYAWQDGRPRYWLIAAPGWRPRWRITDAGVLVWIEGRRGEEATRGRGDGEADEGRLGDAGSENRRGDGETEGRLCCYSPCDQPVPAERLAEGLWSCCDEHGRLWRAEMKTKFTREDLKLF